jgi:hypothetical protein
MMEADWRSLVDSDWPMDPAVTPRGAAALGVDDNTLADTAG